MIGLLGGLFNGGSQGGFMSQPFGDWRSTSGEPTGNPNLAGSYSDIVKEYQTQYGSDTAFDPKDPTSVFSKLMKDQQIQTMLANDPRIIGMQAQAYTGPMNEMADRASERAMKGHIFANMLKVPDRYGEAMARKFDFINPVIQALQNNNTASKPFSSRITFNV
jgi:hypothetical protein